MVYDLTMGGGWKSDFAANAVVEFIHVMDLWPGDILRFREGNDEGTLQLIGTGELILRDNHGCEVDRFFSTLKR